MVSATPTYGGGVIVLIATYRGKPGTGDTIEPLLVELAAATRAEPGCLLYLVNRSTTAAETFVLYEHYVDEDALAAHRELLRPPAHRRRPGHPDAGGACLRRLSPGRRTVEVGIGEVVSAVKVSHVDFAGDDEGCA